MTCNFRALSLDLEVGVQDGRIHAFGAIRTDTGERLPYSGSGFAAALRKLDALADGADFLLGHNLIEHDLPWLAAASPDLRLLKLPAVDTLRLSPLAFPSNPYHRLVKHYKDGGLVRSQRNDPALDSELAIDLFREECKALSKADPDLLKTWHRLCTPDAAGADCALDALFCKIRGARRPSAEEARTAVGTRLEGAACATHGHAVFEETSTGWPLAYALAWLSVAGGNSVMPPWVRHQFPEAGFLVRRLRDTPCADPACGWCRERHDAGKELKRWFGYPAFRPEPAHDDGRPMQQAIVEAAMRGEHVLGILPTGTGKSLCYQIPALSRYDKTGALTVVISPLVALMKDQVDGLEARGIGACVTVNGLLSMPERADALDRVRLGDAGILIIAPEQLRSRSVRRALDQREIGAWVLDEAHCLSRWGHDFRPDYLYVARFISKKAGDGPVPPVLCLTATAKPDVVDDITRHFRDKLGIELAVFDGGAERSNLGFEVIPTSGGEKFEHIHQVLTSHLPPDKAGGAIVYCATRRSTEEVAEYLQLKDVAADYFHAGLPPETRKDVQQRFIGGELRAIAATNAFGMGIDKPDVRLVVHADIPGSLENYFQEAGRAGRDREPARCVLMYAPPNDVERQFGLSARSRLTRPEIHAILRALRNLDRKKRLNGEVAATAGEILGEDEDKAFERDSATDDTRVRTAIAWLEESALLAREENVVQIFPSSLRVDTVEQARRKLEDARLEKTYRSQLLRIAEVLIDADADEGVTTDELMVVARLSAEGVRNALFDLERLGISKNETALTAFVHKGVAHSSSRRLKEAAALEEALIAHMREEAPDMGKGDKAPLHLRIAAQVLQDKGLADPLPMRLWRIVRSISYDGRGEDGGPGSLSIRKRDAETAQVTLRVSWDALAQTAKRRREAARCLLNHLLACLPDGRRGTDLLAETTIGDLNQAIENDLILKGRLKDPVKALDRALLWLHELEIIRLNKGLAVFRPAMTIRLRKSERRGFSGADFERLDLHYKGQVLQIHVMAEFAERGLAAMRDALRLATDYFNLKETDFLEKWLPGRDNDIGRQTTPDSWRAIVESLGNPIQQRIVADKREQTNVLVLAGPGSGKTRVLVHRIAYLVRVRRENPRGILALAYNRHAAVDIRRRLADLIGDDARGVTVLTCHGLAMRLAGASFAGRAEQPDDELFRDVLKRATDLLRGKGLPPEEADERRERLLAGFRWILVDEYQDIGKEEYALISALAGRTLEDETGKLTLFAVGDDDQNIYAFKGASVEFIRRFEADYGPKPAYLTDNYRSTGHIIAAANAIIASARKRMKADRPIRIDRARENDPPGGAWETLDPVSRGKVQILPAGRDPATQAQAVMAELQRLAGRSPEWDWSRSAVIAREWKCLAPVQAFCMARNIPAQMGDEEIPRFWRLRETCAFVAWLRERRPRVVDGAALAGWAAGPCSGRWHDLVRQAIEEHALETGGAETPVDHFIEWLAEWGRDIRRRQHGLLLVTAHGAKGLEFDHVAVLDGGWDRPGRNEDADAPRRLYYVAMTRAQQTLTLARFDGGRNPLLDTLRRHRSVLRRKPAKLPLAPATLDDRYIRPDLKHIDIGFAGSYGERHSIHSAIAAL
ncbi:MAG: RecQ family ATP-dependent DNA helicase [Rhodospirillaceae bacterium]|nr:RecQ family ATP-dependent DNA helicase [Rhodospirillaceae bacterium]